MPNVDVVLANTVVEVPCQYVVKKMPVVLAVELEYEKVVAIEVVVNVCEVVDVDVEVVELNVVTVVANVTPRKFCAKSPPPIPAQVFALTPLTVGHGVVGGCW